MNSHLAYVIGLRVVVDVLLIVLVFTGWWWLTLFVGAGALVIFHRFYEYVVLGIVIDIFFGIATTAWLGFPWWGTLISIGLFIMVQYSKAHIRY